MENRGKYNALMRLLVGFLRKNGLYTRFRQYVSDTKFFDRWETEHNPRPSFFYLYPINSNFDVKNDVHEYMKRILYDSFDFSKSTEGRIYWLKINKQWKELLELSYHDC